MSEMPGITVEQNNNKVMVHGKTFEAGFDKATGTLSSLIYNNRSIINGAENGPLFNLYRATMDNDRTKERGPSIEWEKAGYDSLQYTLRSFTIQEATPQIVKLLAITDAVTRSGFKVTTEILYTVSGNGNIRVDAAFKPASQGLDIPRLGLRMLLEQGLEQIEWYGRGPYENYPDRQGSAAVGRYQSTVTQMQEPYERPQGMGNRGEVHWVKICDDNNQGAMIIAHGRLAFTALHFTDQDLHAAAHLYQLLPRRETVLSLDYAQQGIGNASCGPDPLPAYRIPFQPAKLSFTICAYDPLDGDAAAKAKQENN